MSESVVFIRHLFSNCVAGLLASEEPARGHGGSPTEIDDLAVGVDAPAGDETIIRDIRFELPSSFCRKHISEFLRVVLLEITAQLPALVGTQEHLHHKAEL